MSEYSESSDTCQDQISRPSFREVARARPPRGTGIPANTQSHYDRILELLRERGPAGVLSSELYDNPHLYGRSPRNRVSEARRAGALIETVAVGPSVVRYILIRDCEGNPPPLSPEVPKSDPLTEQPPISDYMARVRQEEAVAMPLFASGVSRA